MRTHTWAFLLAILPSVALAAPRGGKHDGPSFCAPVKNLVAMAAKNDGFKAARGQVVAKDGTGNANAWLSKIGVPGAKCWILNGGGMAQCDFAPADSLGGLDGKLKSCAANGWQDHSSAGKTIFGVGKAGVSLELFTPDASAKGEKTRPRLTVFAPPSEDDGADLLGD